MKASEVIAVRLERKESSMWVNTLTAEGPGEGIVVEGTSWGDVKKAFRYMTGSPPPAGLVAYVGEKRFVLRRIERKNVWLSIA